MDENYSQSEQLIESLKASYASLNTGLTQLRHDVEELRILIEKLEQKSTSSTPDGRSADLGIDTHSDLSDKPTLDLTDDALGLDDFTAIHDATVTPVKEQKSEQTPEEHPIKVSVVGQLSLAESFFYANELFAGNQGLLRIALEELEKMSSKRQLYSYLYDTLRMDRDNENVKGFVAFVENHLTEVC